MVMRSVLVGTGGWAETHIRAYGTCREVELVGLCGHRKAQRTQALAERYAIPAWSLDLRDLLDRTEPDILDIACNPHYRAEGVRAAMRPSIRLINLEKPMALAPSEAYEIERLCRENRKLLTVNHQKKFLPAWRKAKEALDAGTIGQVRFLRASCQGNLLEQGTHLVDMTLHFRGYQPVSWVMAQIDDLEGLDKEGASAPDAASALLRFEDDVRAAMTFGTVGHALPGETNKWHQFALEVYGSEGHIQVTLNKTWTLVTYGDGQVRVEESSWDKHYVQALSEHLDVAARYAQDPRIGHTSDLDRSLASFQVIMAIYASGCGDGRVSLPQRFDDELMARLSALRASRA